MNQLLHDIMPSLYGGTGLGLLQVVPPPADNTHQILSIGIALVTGVLQLIHIYKKKKK